MKTHFPEQRTSWNHHRTAAVSEGPAAASAHAQSRRMIPKRVASPCRCGWCSAHTAPARLEPLPNFVAYATKFGRPTGLCQFLNATETRSRVASRSRSSLNGNHSGHAVLVQHRVLYTLIRMQNRTLRAIIFRNAIRGLLLCDLAAAAAAATVVRENSLSNPKYLRDHAETRGFSLGRPTKALPTPDGQAVL